MSTEVQEFADIIADVHLSEEVRQKSLTLNVATALEVGDDEALGRFYAFNRIVDDQSGEHVTGQMVVRGLVASNRGERWKEFVVDGHHRPASLSEEQLAVLGEQAIALDLVYDLPVYRHKFYPEPMAQYV